VYDPQLAGQQVHDFNPGITQNGVFWTTVVSDSAVQVDLGAGRATLLVKDIAQKDYFTFDNAMLGNGPTPRQGRVSFRVEWTATGEPGVVDDPTQSYRGTVRDAIAKMEWSGRSGDFEFRSTPLAESTTDAAQLGSARNGSYY
jgi:hypothetical protein